MTVTSNFNDTHIPFAIIKGDTPYEIGYQHGKFGKRQILKSIKIYGDLYLETRNISWEIAKNRASKFLPLLEDQYNDILEELKGVADGSNVELLDILALNTRSEITLVDISDGCTSLSQRSTNGDVLVGQNWDWLPEVDDITILLEIHQRDKPKLLIFAEAGIIGKYGFNSNGVALMLNAISSSVVRYDKLPVHFAIRKALEQPTIKDLIKIVEKNGIASAANILVGDQEKFYSIELTTDGIGIIKPDEDGVVYHTNHLIDPTLAEKFPPKVNILNTTTRLDRIRELSKDSTASYNSFFERLNDLQNAPNAICRDAGKGQVGLERCVTLYQIVVNTNKVEGELVIRNHDPLKRYKLEFHG